MQIVPTFATLAVLEIEFEIAEGGGDRVDDRGAAQVRVEEYAGCVHNGAESGRRERQEAPDRNHRRIDRRV